MLETKKRRSPICCVSVEVFSDRPATARMIFSREEAKADSSEQLKLSLLNAIRKNILDTPERFCIDVVERAVVYIVDLTILPAKSPKELLSGMVYAILKSLGEVQSKHIRRKGDSMLQDPESFAIFEALSSISLSKKGAVPFDNHMP